MSHRSRTRASWRRAFQADEHLERSVRVEFQIFHGEAGHRAPAVGHVRKPCIDLEVDARLAALAAPDAIRRPAANGRREIVLVGIVAALAHAVVDAAEPREIRVLQQLRLDAPQQHAGEIQRTGRAFGGIGVVRMLLDDLPGIVDRLRELAHRGGDWIGSVR